MERLLTGDETLADIQLYTTCNVLTMPCGQAMTPVAGSVQWTGQKEPKSEYYPIIYFVNEKLVLSVRILY